MAKLLKSLDINDILKIKYKSPYKVFLQLKNIEETNKILTCQKFKELEFRCQRTDQLSITYGVVKNIDIEMENEELLNVFQSDVDILTINRLKRLDDNGQWIPSEVIRITFKGATLPSYIYGYGCRFKVEAYKFPVTQCSGCWKFGHMKRYCPTQKIKCPKCGQDHNNCETKEYSCINCKGSHMALSKICPIFLKEKTIRNIMSVNSYTYKKALDIYLTNKKQKERFNQSSLVDITANTSTHKKSYRDVVLSAQDSSLLDNNEEINMAVDEHSSNEEINEHVTTSQRKKNRRRNDVQDKKQQTKNNSKKEIEKDQNEKRQDEQVDKTEKISNFRSFLKKSRDILLSRSSFEEKISDIVRLIIGEVKLFISSFFKDTDVVSRLLSFFSNG
ncbi:unnamed protein product [Euphydryas editha]|nr:unnamed protein product [Euphydryas editha]